MRLLDLSRAETIDATDFVVKSETLAANVLQTTREAHDAINGLAKANIDFFFGDFEHLLVEGFDENQIWELLQLQNKPLSAFLRKTSTRLSHAIEQHRVPSLSDENYEVEDLGGDLESHETSKNTDSSESDLNLDNGDDGSDMSTSAYLEPGDSMDDDEAGSGLDQVKRLLGGPESDSAPYTNSDSKLDSDPEDSEDGLAPSCKRQRMSGTRESEASENEDDDMFAKSLEELEAEDAKPIMYANFYRDAGEQDDDARHGSELSEMSDASMDDDDDDEDGAANSNEDEEDKSDDDEEDTLNEAKIDLFERLSEQRRQSEVPHNEKIQQQIDSLERKNLEAKPWELSGEVGAENRPSNSLLEKNIEFSTNILVNKLLVTPEVNAGIEALIKQRIKDSIFDDVKRTESLDSMLKPLTPKIELNMEKSQKSLTEVYEDAYMKSVHNIYDNPDQKLRTAHDEIAKEMSIVLGMLDAISNFHYSPSTEDVQVKAVTTAAAIQMEDVLPVTMSTSSALAPEEVHKHAEKEARAFSEMSKTEKMNIVKKKKRAFGLQLKKKESMGDNKLISRDKTILKTKQVPGEKIKYASSNAFFGHLNQSTKPSKKELRAQEHDGQGPSESKKYKL